MAILNGADRKTKTCPSAPVPEPSDLTDDLQHLSTLQHEVLHQDIVGKHRDDDGFADVTELHRVVRSER
jgi:hypothetical protein